MIDTDSVKYYLTADLGHLESIFEGKQPWVDSMAGAPAAEARTALKADAWNSYIFRRSVMRLNLDVDGLKRSDPLSFYVNDVILILEPSFDE